MAITVALALVPAFAAAADQDDDESALEQVIVTATRSPGLIRDEPLRVEAVPAEEIEENLTVQPGNLTTLLHELPGVRVQSSAPGLGGAGLQLRGMPPGNTLVLADGLPLLGTVPDSFGLLQTPPLDLERVEVIKGAVSALYGGAALGGVLNLVSRSADSEPALLANLNSRGGQDLVGFFTHRDNSPWSESLTAGIHHQSREDVDGDGWSDLAGYRRFTARPRVWWHGDSGRSLFLTAGITYEHRAGGTLPGRTLPFAGAFPEALYTSRLDVGAVSHAPLASGDTLSGRYSFTSNREDRMFGAQETGSTQSTLFGEQTLNGQRGPHRWVLGVAFAHEALSVPSVAGVGYDYSVPAVYAQDAWSLTPSLIVAGSARVDFHNAYGTFFSPRLSALLRRPAGDWSLRASFAGGFAAPVPQIEQIQDIGFGTLLPLRGLQPERATTASLDAHWADEGWEMNLSVYTSKIRHPLVVEAAGGSLQISNAVGPRRAPGAELLLGYVGGPLQLLASFSAIHPTEPDPAGGRRNVSLVPRTTGSLDVILEDEARGRIGVELDYTGSQALDNDPYRTTSPAYYSVNALGELRFGHIAIFCNAINLTDVRQTHFDPLLRPGPGPGGNPITETWAPLDGRTFNLGVRAEL